ncbi:hypothetical protein JAAARDRAFT_38558 [Jaapia argillacea MUCL 33604]|uniref:Uncharacterized protein n=1 Tax=Jaapia argillacea MUCL 33604 TaxID=933084 RepID=A0A067PSW7_9AGAM|nr:hypothetical protein JAAARDRAFT_38558 [Jaapia argillacea MUCL 33604]
MFDWSILTGSSSRPFITTKTEELGYHLRRTETPKNTIRISISQSGQRGFGVEMCQTPLYRFGIDCERYRHDFRPGQRPIRQANMQGLSPLVHVIAVVWVVFVGMIHDPTLTI